jgi:hypothetical protein
LIDMAATLIVQDFWTEDQSRRQTRANSPTVSPMIAQQDIATRKWLIRCGLHRSVA